jgi:ribosome-binding protein aMBF1 (putative translation factor)
MDFYSFVVTRLINIRLKVIRIMVSRINDLMRLVFLLNKRPLMRENSSRSKPKERKTPLQKAFGKLIRARRMELGLSQEELAERAAMHFTYVSSIERGERNISLANIAKLAKALGCSMNDLMPK